MYYWYEKNYYEVNLTARLITVYTDCNYPPIVNKLWVKTTPSYLLNLVRNQGYDCRYADSYIQR